MKRRVQPRVLFLCSLLSWSTHLAAQNEIKRQVVDLEAEDGKRLWALLHKMTDQPLPPVASLHHLLQSQGIY